LFTLNCGLVRAPENARFTGLPDVGDIEIDNIKKGEFQCRTS